MGSSDYQFFHENEIKVTMNIVKILRWLTGLYILLCSRKVKVNI